MPLTLPSRQGLIHGLLIAALGLAACAPNATSTMVSSTETPAPTMTARPTATSIPTKTPRPTATPRPSATQRPAATHTPYPDTIRLSGLGDQMVDIEKWAGPALLHATSEGDGNFIIETYNAEGENIDLLVNMIGSYEGTRPLDLKGNEMTTRLQITASGPWEITITTLLEVRTEDGSTPFGGQGDDVVMVSPARGRAELLQIDTTAEGIFAVWCYGNDSDLVFFTADPGYHTVLVPPTFVFDSGAVLLVIESEVEWTIEVTIT